MAGPDQTPAAAPLRLTPELLTALCRLVPTGLCLVDESARFVAVNEPYARLYGYTCEELRGQPITVLVPPEERAACRAAFARLLEGECRHSPTKSRRWHKDGFPVWTEWQMSLLAGEDGRRLLLFTVTDITARTRAERAQQASEERLRTAQAIARVGHWEVDLATRRVWASPEAFRIYGIEQTSDELLLEQVQRAVLPAYRPAMDRALGRLIAGEGEYDEEFEIVRQGSGERLFLHSKAELLQDSAGRPLRVVGVLQDITASKRVEQALTVRTRQLEAVRAVSEEITRELDLGKVLQLVSQRVGELVGRGRGGVCLWHEAAQALVPHTHYRRDDRQPAVKLPLGQGVAGRVAESREGLIVNDYRSWPGVTAELRARAKVTAIMAEPLLYGDRLVGVIHLDTEEPDVAFTEEDRALLRLVASHAAAAVENARLFAELNESYARLHRAQEELIRSEKLRGLGQMAAGIAHDLNNMLAAVLGQVELLKLRGTTPEVREGLATLEIAATDGASVVRRLQDFARQRTSSQLVPMDPAQAVREALEITRPRWRDEPQRRGVTIAVEAALPALPSILGYPPEIREALTNLIFNAVDAMPQGGTLTLRGRLVDPATADPGETTTPSPQSVGRPVDPSTPRVELTVADTGVGMSAAVREKLFEPFFTTKGVRGTGLGLSVVYGILERHGGAIGVTSSPGRGTSVTLQFQVAPQAVAPPSTPPPRTPVPRRILLIEDEPLVRTTIGSLLRAAGHTVLEAESGAAGLALFAAQAVDCVLTDLGMPEMTGWEVAGAIKRRSPSLPVILLTGWGEQAAATSANRILVDRVLGKPVALGALLQAIGDLSGDGTAVDEAERTDDQRAPDASSRRTMAE